jgi:hypothetical protein
MSRVRLNVIAAVAALAATSLTGCSGGSLSMPDWMSLKSSPPPPQTLQFESDPPGADVRTAQGQTCQTPCALNVPPESQAVSFTKMGYLPQTVAVTISIPEHSMFESPPPNIQPNPVAVVLQPAGPPPKLKKPPLKRPHAHKPAAAAPAAAAPAAGAPPPPGQDSAFPPPPPPQQR